MWKLTYLLNLIGNLDLQAYFLHAAPGVDFSLHLNILSLKANKFDNYFKKKLYTIVFGLTFLVQCNKDYINILI